MNAENPAEFKERAKNIAWTIEKRLKDEEHWLGTFSTLQQLIYLALQDAFLAGKRSVAPIVVWPKIVLPPLTEIPGAREADYAYHRGYERGREDYYTETLRLNPRINKVGESGERG